MDRRTLLFGLLGGLAVAPAIIVAPSSVEAAPLPEALSPTPERLPEPASPTALTGANLETVKPDWTQGVFRRRSRRIARRTSRRVVRRRRYY
jgi:hypothetical protein